MSKNKHWGLKKMCKSSCGRGVSRTAFKRSVEKGTRQRGKRDLRRRVEDA